MNPLINAQVAANVVMAITAMLAFFHVEIDAATQKAMTDALVAVGVVGSFGLLAWGQIKDWRAKKALVNHTTNLTAQVVAQGIEPVEPTKAAAKVIAAVEKAEDQTVFPVAKDDKPA